MPRRGNNNYNNRNWGGGGQQNNETRYIKNQHFDHDDRTERKQIESRKTNRGRRVSFKPAGAGGGGGGGGGSGLSGRLAKGGYSAELAIRTRLEEDDDMIDGRVDYGTVDGHQHRNSKGNLRMRRRGSPIPKGSHGLPHKRKLVASTSGWFQVTIPHGQKYDKQQVLRKLMEVVHPQVFIPHYFKIEPACIVFFVDDIRVAETLLNSDRQITLPDGFKMLIRVRNSIPHVQIDENLKQKMKMAMVKRYAAQTKALDLTKFHSDDDLRDIFCALFRPTIMLAAIDVIAENIPDLEALKLDDNKIQLMDHLKCLAIKLPHLKILHLANNKISSTNALDSLKSLELIELALDGNPVKKMREETTYVSEIRKKFPKLQKLDGVILPAQIGFDITDDFKLPIPKASFLCDMAGADIVRQFLEQYYIIFDSENRNPLLDAYHENAMFSMTATYTTEHYNRLSAYLPQNRNLIRTKDLENRCRLTKNGRLSVVSFLTELPLCQHDPQSFAVDLTLFTPQLIMLTVTGIFKQKTNKSNDLLRSFQKVLVIVPSGTGFCIKNEMLHINNVTAVQARSAFKPAVVSTNTTTAAAVAAPLAGTTTQTIAPAQQGPAGGAVVPDESIKLQMVQAMSQHSNMNVEWSRKCLEETNWEFDRAGYVFTELHKQNKIPPEAFIK